MINAITGLQYAKWRNADETGPYAKFDCFAVESAADDEGMYTMMRASGPLHGQRFRVSIEWFQNIRSVYDRTIDKTRTASEIAALVGCTVAMVEGQ